jgi:hypothetical protein
MNACQFLLASIRFFLSPDTCRQRFSFDESDEADFRELAQTG